MPSGPGPWTKPGRWRTISRAGVTSTPTIEQRSRRWVSRHLRKHGDVEKSLAALATGRLTREKLAGIGDAEVEATLARIGFDSGSGSTEVSPDPDRTGSYAVGSATSDGQRFRLRPHARGGLGAVFVAIDSELNREVALKQILDRGREKGTSLILGEGKRDITDIESNIDGARGPCQVPNNQ